MHRVSPHTDGTYTDPCEVFSNVIKDEDAEHLQAPVPPNTPTIARLPGYDIEISVVASMSPETRTRRHPVAEQHSGQERQLGGY